MTNLKYKLENAEGSKTVTINNVRSDIDSQTAKVSAFGSQLSTYFSGDYEVTAAVKVVTEETEIEI